MDTTLGVSITPISANCLDYIIWLTNGMTNAFHPKNKTTNHFPMDLS